MAYAIKDARGRTWYFSEDRHDLTEFSDFGTAEVISDDYRLASVWDLDDGVGVAFGRGSSTNPDRAEAYFHFDAQDDGNADINGRGKLVVLNTANEKVGLIYQGPLASFRRGDPTADERGKWGVPFPYQAIRSGAGEVLGNGGYKVGMLIQTDSATGTATFSTANSSMTAEGYRGTVQN